MGIGLANSNKKDYPAAEAAFKAGQTTAGITRETIFDASKVTT